MMLSIVSLLSLFFIGSCQGPSSQDQGVQTDSPGSQLSDDEILEFLDTLFAQGQEQEMYNMPEADGNFLRFLITSNRCISAMEIGTSNGLSAIWMGLGLRETGGRLVTIEIDHDKAEEAKRNIKRVGLDNIIEVIEGDAFEVIPTLSGPFDFVHLDAWKEQYKGFYEAFYSKVKPGGLIAAHNAILMGTYFEDYLELVQSTPELLTTIVQTSNDGFAVSYKRIPSSDDSK
jgi:predicted O-methyltransferase YrrM